MKLSDLKIDPVKVEQGAWVDDIPEMGGLRLRVRGLQNNDFRKMQSRLVEAEPRQNKPRGRLLPERQEAITGTCLVETVLLDWDGITDEADQPIPYSKEQAKEFLTDPAYRRLRDAVVWAASVVAEDGVQETEEAGNSSKKRSAGT
ncbi:MAG TPA: hypothetical protein VGN98_07785 [Tianweitania sediminis]|jgi:hypothetical protein|nr:hypothetical protein [Tianweitania sediminis]